MAEDFIVETKFNIESEISIKSVFSVDSMIVLVKIPNIGMVVILKKP